MLWRRGSSELEDASWLCCGAYQRRARARECILFKRYSDKQHNAEDRQIDSSFNDRNFIRLRNMQSRFEYLDIFIIMNANMFLGN